MVAKNQSTNCLAYPMLSIVKHFHPLYEKCDIGNLTLRGQLSSHFVWHEDMHRS